MPHPHIRLTFYLPAFTLLAFTLLTSCVAGPGPGAAPAIENASAPTPGISSFASATVSPDPTASAQNPPFAIPQIATAAPGIDPLTGLPPADPSYLQRRPVAIKVANYPRYIRPQAGLTYADVVFEYYIEALLTRFIAVYYGNNPNMVGPVRSGRYFDEHVVRMYHAFYVFQYADPREFQYFYSGDLRSFLMLQGYGPCPPFFDSRRPVETYNNAYFDVTKLNDCALQFHLDNSPQNIRSGFFSMSLPSGGYLVERIFTHYSVDDYNYWQYDPMTQRYLRFQEADDTRDNKPKTYAPLVDYLNNQQVSADNVIVLFVSHTFLNAGEQQDEVYHINLVDSGQAFVFRNGLAFPARWFRSDIDQPLLITNLDGTPLYLKPGQTFFQIIGVTSTDWSDGADWHFDFHTP
ncbi:MAG: DUF3048 domain-containing protein [Chloroflexi bacterium]|nr:DUF3048 domain-containing protein [Chloroflexota bacterium]